jgi:hypothetical protein
MRVDNKSEALEEEEEEEGSINLILRIFIY